MIRPVHIRMASNADLPALAPVLARGRAQAWGEPDAPGKPIRAEVRGEELLVACDGPGGAPLGFAAIYRPHRFLHHLYVDPDFQENGVGSALLSAALALAGGEIELKCLEANAKARAFYDAKGFIPTGQTGEDSGGRWLRLRSILAARRQLNLAALPLAMRYLQLEPFAPSHREKLREAAADDRLWRWWPRPMADWDAAFDWQIAEHAAGRFQFFCVVTPSGKAVGQTSYLNLAAEHARVEIGHTWYTREAQGGKINPAAKYLLLGHAFASGAQRVEFKTDANNARSRAAILKLGAQFEGVHRKHMRRPDGAWRDTAWYSILAEEWQSVRAGLEKRLGL